jgi:stearoyl-CoA desaturase (delta-9 desaturase)
MPMTFKVRLSQIMLGITRWFDSTAGSGAELIHGPQRMDLVRSIPFIVLHLSALAVIWVGWSWVALGVALGFYLIRMFFITGFYHRYFSHRTYRTSRAGQLGLALLGATCVQRGPLWWAAHHRLHHQRSDEEDDVHSPIQHGFLWSHIGWITSKSNFPTRLDVVPDLARYPELRFLDRFDTLIPVLLIAGMGILGGWLRVSFPNLHTSGPQMICWGFCLSTLALFHASCTINSLSHRMGKRRYVTGDESRNSFLLALLTFGEGWHNNHHYYPGSAAQAHYWWEVDLTYYLLKAMSWVGIIWDLNPVPERVLQGKAEAA